VNDALRPLGVEILHSPISPRQIVEAVLAARQAERPPA
jgi:carbon-monoxide dehydrogenase large subunit